MTEVYKFRVWCEQDEKSEYVWGETEPTMCPVSGHPIDTDLTVIVETVAQEQEYVDGHAIVAPTYGYFDEDAGFKGFRIIASGVDTDTLHDHQITNQIMMNGGVLWTSGGTCGDYGEASIVDKDDILGLFDTYGLVSGVDVLELFKFAETIYFNVNGQDVVDLRTPDAALVYPGLYIRTKVHTVGLNPICLGITYFWFEE